VGVRSADRSTKPGVVSYDFVKEERRVNAYYFYIYDDQFGPGFIKIRLASLTRQGMAQRP